MAITIDDFSKIWASTSPLTPYEFSENNYKQGWNFVGGTPPSRQMWDFLQKNNDEKMQYLANNYLPLSGGTMVGAIKGNPLTLTADDGNGNTTDLVINPNGSTTINENHVMTNPIAGLGARQIRVYNNRQAGTFTLSEPSNQWGMCALVAFTSPTTQGMNRIFMCRGYWTGAHRTEYYRIPFDLDSNTDGVFTVAIAQDSDRITFTVTEIGGIYGVATVLAESPDYPVTFTWTPA